MSNFLMDYLPLICFFIFYKLYGMKEATISLIIITIISMFILYYSKKKIQKHQIITNIIVIIMSLITLLTGDFKFIQLKPTIIYLSISLILIFGIINNKLFMKYLFQNAFEMHDSNWKKFSLRFIVYFLFMAILNEIIWRNFSENFWVNYKLFGTMILSVLFLISQIPFLFKNSNLRNKK